MTITNFDQLVDALANNSSRIVLDKNSITQQISGRYCSMWRATGQPAQGAIPTSAALCTTATQGAIQFTQQVAPSTSYISLLDIVSSNNAQTVEIHDRIAHTGGLVLNVTSLQPPTGVLIDLEALEPSAARIGELNYNDIQTWLEVYSDGGGTASNATINVTFDDNTSGNLSTIAVGGTIRAGNLFSVDALRTTAQQGKNIKRINSVQLSASTGTAGNFGFTFTRPRIYAPTEVALKSSKLTWGATGLPNVPNDSCLFFIVLPSTTNSGSLRGGGKISHG